MGGRAITLIISDLQGVGEGGVAGGGVAGAESKEIREIDKGDKVEVGAISDKPHWGVL